MNAPIKCMLVDDQLLFLESLKLVVENLDPAIEVSALAQSGEESLEKIETAQPEIILMDVRMPHLDGVKTTGIIKKQYPDIKVIMLTTFEDDEYVKEALKNGAVGYMLKNIPPQMLVSAIRAVYNGSILISPDIAGHLIESLYETPNHTEKDLKTELPYWYKELTPKEKTIIKLIMKEFTNKEISAHIHVGEQTIRNYISSIYSKLEVHDRKSAIEKARTIRPYLFN